MKRVIIFLILFLIASCKEKLETPIPGINPVTFAKEGGTITVPMSETYMFVYDKTLGYTHTHPYDSQEGFHYELLDCGWVLFKGFPYYITYDLHITVIPNTTGKERSLTMMFESVLNTQHSGRSSIKVIQKGD